jgi:hypothetical protein
MAQAQAISLAQCAGSENNSGAGPAPPLLRGRAAKRAAGYDQPSSLTSKTLTWKVPDASGGSLVNQSTT